MSEKETFNRRQFLKEAGLVTLTSFILVEELQSAPAPPPQPAGPPVGCGIIGVGQQGREILSHLARFPNAQVNALCDVYQPALNRGKESAPKAKTFTDYRSLLDQKDVQAVFIATPTHQHKQIVLDALQAGKHVYCEAPLASSIEDAKAIAQSAQASKQVFQAGLQRRSAPISRHVLQFVRTGVLEQIVGVRSQWHRKTSWRRPAPSPDQDKEMNWKLYKDTSLGLAGEVGIHQIDLASWFLKAFPLTITGFGSLIKWKDGREQPDTIQCILEFPNGVRMYYDATLANSFESSSDLFFGTNSTLMIRGELAWIFKEVDSPLLGWEVYAYKEKFGDDEGIALVADATKLLQQGKEPAKFAKQSAKPALYHAISAFLGNIRGNKLPAATAEEGYQATIIAIKANEAILSGNKLTIDPSLLKIS